MSIPRSPDLLRLSVAVAAALFGCATAHADQPDPAAARARIAQERAHVQQRYTQTVQQCETKFFVTHCVDDAKALRREQLQRLDSEQAVLDDADRRRRAADQLQRIAEKEKAAAQRAASAPSPRVVRRGAPQPAAGPLVPGGTLPSPDMLTPAERDANRRAYEQRQRDAAAHRAEVERRNANDAPAKGALPLPPAAMPASAAASAP
jgi:hypothetical protein